jgi:DNA-binding transcriptional regulator LsrR (DeoR family)
MTKYRRGHERDELLADVAEMYYLDNLTQSEVSRAIGMTRSAVSRMLTEARQKGIVEITVHRPLSYDSKLEEALIERFNLLDAHVLSLQQETNYDTLRNRLGQTAAGVLKVLFHPQMICGVTWGTTVSATISVLQVPNPIPMQIVQLGGVLGSSSHAYNAQALVDMLSKKVGGEGVYLYSPFLVENAETARSILSIPNVRETIKIGKRSDIALLGIGTITDADYSSLYQGGHFSMDTIDELRESGAVGDVNGIHFDAEGNRADTTIHDRLVAITGDELLAIPIRFGVAGGHAKAEAILGALRGGYVNQLVTDSLTAAAVLVLDKEAESEMELEGSVG